MFQFPNLPGVPALFPIIGNQSVISPTSAMAAPPPSGNNMVNSLKPLWGIYDAAGTNTVLDPDSFISIDFNNEMNISNYPIEQGQFASYNKVRTPYKAPVKVTKGSLITTTGTSISAADRDEFLDAIDSLLTSLELCTIVTPEASYSNANLESYNYRREVRNGAGIIIAELRFVEIMLASSFQSTSAGVAVTPNPTANVSPSSQAPVNLGAVQLGSTYKPLVPVM